MQEAKKSEAVVEVKKDEKKEVYYTTRSKKVIDFLIGFLGAPAVIIITARFFPDLVVLIYLLTLGASAVAFFKERRFMGFGILLIIVAIPLIVFGSCLAILGGLGR